MGLDADCLSAWSTRRLFRMRDTAHHAILRYVTALCIRRDWATRADKLLGRGRCRCRLWSVQSHVRQCVRRRGVIRRRSIVRRRRRLRSLGGRNRIFLGQDQFLHRLANGSVSVEFGDVGRNKVVLVLRENGRQSYERTFQSQSSDEAINHVAATETPGCKETLWHNWLTGLNGQKTRAANDSGIFRGKRHAGNFATSELVVFLHGKVHFGDADRANRIEHRD